MSGIKIELDKGILAALVDRVKHTISPFDVKPVLHNYLLIAEKEEKGSKITLLGSDMEFTGVVTTKAVKVSESGKVTIPASKLQDAVRVASDGPMTLTIDGKDCVVTSGKSSWKFMGIEPSEFPDLNTDIGPDGVKLDRETLLAALQTAVSCASKDENRAAYMFVSVQGKIALAADGSRVARFDIPAAKDLNITVPTSIVNALIKILSVTTAAQVTMTKIPEHNVIQIGEDIFIIREMAEEYPFEEVLESGWRGPETFTHLALMDKAELLTALKRVSVTADDDQFRTVELTCSAISAKVRSQIGEEYSEDNITAETKPTAKATKMTGEIRIRLNKNLLAEILGVLTGETVHLYLLEKTNEPVLIQEKVKEGVRSFILFQVRDK